MSYSSSENPRPVVCSTPSTTMATVGSELRTCDSPRTFTKVKPMFCVSTTEICGAMPT